MKQQTTIRALVDRNVKRQLVREFLLRETERAGFSGLTFTRTPEGTKISLRAEQVGMHGEPGSIGPLARVSDVDSCRKHCRAKVPQAPYFTLTN